MLKTINGIIIGVLYPSISKVKDNKEKLRSSFIDVSQIMFSIYGFIVLLGFLFSKQAVSVILGEKWNDLAPLIPIFLLLAFFFALGSVGSHYLKALGYSKLIFKIVMFTSILTIVSFIIGIKWGIIGVAIGYLFATIILYICLTCFCSKHLGIKIESYIPLYLKDAVALALTVILFNLISLDIIIHSNLLYLLIGTFIVSVILFTSHMVFKTQSYKVIKLLITK